MNDILAELHDIAVSLRRIADSLESLTPTKVEQRVEDKGNQNKKSNDFVDSDSRKNILRNFLLERNIKIKVERERVEADDTLDRLAEFMGSRYQQVKTFYERIKSNMNDGKSFTLSMKDDPQDVVSSTCQLATELYQLAFLEDYKYLKSPQYLLHARPSRLPMALNFFSGGWLERYALVQAFQAAKKCDNNINFSYLKNPQIILPNGDDFELDILFEVEGEIYWMELKTGDYQKHIAKYSKISKILGLNWNRCFMVLTEIPPNTASSLSSLFQMTVTPVEDLGKILRETMSTHLVCSNNS